MTERTSWARRSALALVGAAVAMPAWGLAAGEISALAALERGRWEVRDVETGQTRAAVCLGDPAQLVQPEHAGAACPFEVIEDGKSAATAQYSCGARGFGHTHVRVETPRLIRIDTQGLSNGRPFSYRLQGKKLGNC